MRLYRQLEAEKRLQDALTVDDVESLTHDYKQVREESDEDATNRIFKENAAAAAQTIANIALFGRNERVRLAAAQYVVERVVGRVQDNPPAPKDDPFSALRDDLEKAASAMLSGEYTEGD